MFRSEKIQLVEALSQQFGASPHVFLTSFRGLSANQANELRRRVREAGGAYRVIKNRLAKRAASGSGVDRIVERLSGPCALALHPDDPVGLAKLLTDFAKDNPQLTVLAGVIDAQQVMDQDGVKELSSLPGLPELQAQLLALVNTPATMLVRLLSTPGTQLARVLDARREKLESES